MSKLNLPLQGELRLGGRGTDRFVEVQKRSDGNWLFMVDTSHGPRQVMKLDMSENKLYFYGDSRVPPFATLDLTKSGAKKLRREVKKAYEVEKG